MTARERVMYFLTGTFLLLGGTALVYSARGWREWRKRVKNASEVSRLLGGDDRLPFPEDAFGP